jgi:hypothetical protein
VTQIIAQIEPSSSVTYGMDVGTHAFLCLCVHITDHSLEWQTWTTKTSEMCPSSLSILYYFQDTNLDDWSTKAVGTEVSHSPIPYCH